MRNNMKKFLKTTLVFIISAVMLVTSVPPAFAGTSITSYSYWATAASNPGLAFNVGSYEEGGIHYIMLPSSFTGDTVTVNAKNSFRSVTGAVSYDSGSKTFVMSAAHDSMVKVNSVTLVIKRTVLPALSISIDDGYSLDTIHADKDKKIKAHAQITGSENGQYDLASTQIEFKTRGNSTFYFIKKPYQIKFDSKTSLFGMPKAKKWVLLANYLDGTGIKSKVAFDVATELGMTDTPQSEFVDLFIDGEYNGTYQLIEKNEIGKGRVELEDEYGVLLEMESAKRLDGTDISFAATLSKKPYVFKEYVTDLEDTSTPEAIALSQQVQAFAKNKINSFESALYSTSSTWEDVAKHIDVDSFIQYYFLNETFEQIDCMLASTYFYFDGAADVIHCGPVWDFDRICGFQTDCESSTNSDFVKNLVENTDEYRCDIYKQLFRYPEFTEMVNDYFENTAKDILTAEHINGLVDYYQQKQWNSLMANYIRWYYIFVDLSTTADDVVGGTFADQVNYVTNKMKTWVTARCAYLATAYGSAHPMLTYSPYGAYTDKTLTWTSNYNAQWHPAVSGGTMTYGASMTGFKMDIGSSPVSGSLTYTLYSGTDSINLNAGESHDFGKYITAFSARLTGNLANYFDIEYRILQSKNVTAKGYNGWSAWTKNGTRVGDTSSASSSLNINKIQIRLVAKKDIEYGTVNLSVNGKVTPVTGVLGNTFTPDAPSLGGYNFLGWYFTSDFTGAPVTSVSYAKTPMTLYAKLEATAVAGDIDGDGYVRSTDVLVFKQYLSGIEPTDFVSESADLDGDGKLTARDVLTLRLYVSGKITLS